MIRLTKKLLFAIEAVLDIAYNGGQAPVRSSEITERQGIPRRYLRTLQGLETAENPISDPAGSPLGHCIVRPLWLDLQQEVMQRLDSLTMEELCGRAHRAGIAGRTTEYTDFEN